MFTPFKIKSAVLVAAVLLVGLAALSAQAQVMTKTFKCSGGDVFMLPGLGALIMEDTTGIKVVDALAKESLPEEYKETDLLAGDVLLMLDGKEINSVAHLKELLDTYEVGQEMTFGLERNGSTRLSTYIKADENEGAQMQMVTMKVGDGEEEGTTVASSPGMTQITLDGAAGPVIPIMEAGIILVGDDVNMSVATLLPAGIGSLEGATPAEGDAIILFQGEAVESGEHLKSLYDDAEVGTTITFSFVHDGEKQEASFTKQEPQGTIMMKR